MVLLNNGLSSPKVFIINLPMAVKGKFVFLFSMPKGLACFFKLPFFLQIVFNQYLIV